jgi:hypothetical protein
LRSVAAVACIAVLAAGCGVEDSDESGASAPRDEPPLTQTEPRKPHKPEDGASSFSVIGEQGTEDRTPVTELYGVFSRPGRARDKASAGEVAHFAEPEGGCGAPVSDQARLLLSGIGSRGYDLVAVPTSKGYVAYGLLPTGSGACGLPLQGGLLLAGEIDAGAVLHYGLVPDDVESIEVVFNGVTHKARMGENAFAVEVRGASQEDTGQIVVHRRDGTTQKLF